MTLYSLLVKLCRVCFVLFLYNKYILVIIRFLFLFHYCFSDLLKLLLLINVYQTTSKFVEFLKVCKSFLIIQVILNEILIKEMFPIKQK